MNRAGIGGVTACILLLATLGLAGPRGPAGFDESIFVKGLRPDQHESLLYVWTRDADGKDSDFLSVVDVDPGSATYGTIVATALTGSTTNEAHHFGYTVEADRIFAGGLFSNRMFIYDLSKDPRTPELIRTVDLDPTGYSGPHTMYAVPGGVMVTMLGTPEGGPPGGLVMLDDDGNFIESYPKARHDGPPVFMYDVGVKLELNRMVTSSWAPPMHIKHSVPPPEDVGDAVVVWDFKTKKVLQVEHLDKAPLEVRWLHGPTGLGGFVNCSYGETVWYWEDADEDGRLEFRRVLELPEGSSPADMRISYDNQLLYLSLWGGNAVRQYDISTPLEPRLIEAVELPQPAMMRLAPDSKRLYVSNSILSTMDGDVSFGIRQYDVGPEGMRLNERFHPDFQGFETGPAGPHDMLLK